MQAAVRPALGLVSKCFRISVSVWGDGEYAQIESRDDEDPCKTSQVILPCLLTCHLSYTGVEEAMVGSPRFTFRSEDRYPGTGTRIMD